MGPTLLIVDDHADFRTFARALLTAEGCTVVGEAADGAGALAAVAALRPEVVILDIALPDLDGIAVAAQLATIDNSPTVVLVSSRDASAYGTRLTTAAAAGFLPKSALSRRAITDLIA